jgi:hypothetical protein
VRFVGVVLVATVVAFTASGGDSGRASRLAAEGCKTSYDYAGLQTSGQASGIRVTLTMVKKPVVKHGHVAGWLGVGGPGLGPNGTDEWIQVGYSGFDTGESQIYHEVAQPNKPPTYHTVAAKLSPSAKNRVSVLEVGDKPGSWRVWVGDKAVSPVTSLPESHGKFVPQALGETWQGGSTNCNVWGYGFGGVQVAMKPGGSWTTTKAGYKWQNPQQKLEKTSSDSFEARSAAGATAAAPDQPPLLGQLASRLLRRTERARCVPHSEPARVEPSGTLLLSRDVCRILLGYAVAEPWAPRAGTVAGVKVAVVTLGFLRAIVRVGGANAAKVDCGAVGRFYGFLRGLGATPEQALALRGALLRARATATPTLSLPPSCRIR